MAITGTGRKANCKSSLGCSPILQGNRWRCACYGNSGDPSTVAEQIDALTKQFAIQEVIFVGDRGMVKKAGKQALGEAGFRYITALTDPQIRIGWRTESATGSVCRASLRGRGQRCALCPAQQSRQTRRIEHQLEDKLAKLRSKIASRNERVEKSSRCKPEAGLATLKRWASQHKLAHIVELKLQERQMVQSIDEEAKRKSVELAGCYVLVSDVGKEKLSNRTDSRKLYGATESGADFRTMKTGLLEIHPVFVRKESRTRGHVFCSMLALKLQREVERRLASVSAPLTRTATPSLSPMRWPR